MISKLWWLECSSSWLALVSYDLIWKLLGLVLNWREVYEVFILRIFPTKPATSTNHPTSWKASLYSYHSLKTQEIGKWTRKTREFPLNFSEYFECIPIFHFQCIRRIFRICIMHMKQKEKSCMVCWQRKEPALWDLWKRVAVLTFIPRRHIHDVNTRNCHKQIKMSKWLFIWGGYQFVRKPVHIKVKMTSSYETLSYETSSYEEKNLVKVRIFGKFTYLINFFSRRNCPQMGGFG
jgi:hypothetical protein